jgi:cell division protein FtsI/penicillin-binding protein 2
MNVHEALVRSCDVVFYQVGQRLGVDNIADYAHRFGLGAPTGITLEHERRHHPEQRVEAAALRRALVCRRASVAIGQVTSPRHRCRWRTSWPRSPTTVPSIARSS